MFDRTFEIVWLIGVIAGSAIRGVYVARAHQWWKKREETADDRMDKLDRLLVSLNSLGLFIVPFLYVLTPWLDFADYHLPVWAGWIGAAFFAVGLWLLWRSHAELESNFSPELQLKEDHVLITEGVFRHIRHPMYSAHFFWAIAQILLLQNWIAGFSLLVGQIPLYIYRIPREEKMMLEHFGEEYRIHMEQTGRFIPRLFR